MTKPKNKTKTNHKRFLFLFLRREQLFSSYIWMAYDIDWCWVSLELTNFLISICLRFISVMKLKKKCVFFLFNFNIVQCAYPITVIYHTKKWLSAMRWNQKNNFSLLKLIILPTNASLLKRCWLVFESYSKDTTEENIYRITENLLRSQLHSVQNAQHINNITYRDKRWDSDNICATCVLFFRPKRFYAILSVYDLKHSKHNTGIRANNKHIQTVASSVNNIFFWHMQSVHFIINQQTKWEWQTKYNASCKRRFY